MSQCNTTADCLEQLARVMRQFNIDVPGYAIRSKYVKYIGESWVHPYFPDFPNPTYWEFAIAEVECKPVFIGDELYDSLGDINVAPYTKNGLKMTFPNDHKWSWNPPKNPPNPKTVTVAIDRNIATKFVNAKLTVSEWDCIAEILEKALTK